MKTAQNGKADAMELLTAGIEKLTGGEEWQRFLRVQSRFHTYSWGNSLLIAIQREDATRVAGYRAWQALGRQVRKGEKSIRILAPLRYKTENEKTGEDEFGVRGFTTVGVFDVSQTDGEEIPEVVHQLCGDDPALLKHFGDRAAALGFSVRFVDAMAPGVNGLAEPATGRIEILSTNPPEQQAKTLAHEMAHCLAHQNRESDQRTRELEAESIAYVVCAHYGLDTGQYTFGYVAHWAGGEKAVDMIRQSAGRIQSMSRLIINEAPERQEETA